MVARSDTPRTNDLGSADTGGVVVPAISVPSSVACLRSLGGQGITTYAISEHARPPAFTSKYCDHAISVPAPETSFDRYQDALLALAARDDVVTIVPMREEDVYALAHRRDSFSQYISTPWPTSQTLARVQDRKQLFDHASRAGVATPVTTLLDQDVDWERPWVVKSRYTLLANEYLPEIPSDQCHSPPSTTYVPPGQPPDVDRLIEEMAHVPILQEYIPGTDEFGFFALCDHGTPLATFQHRQIRGYTYAGGASAYRKSMYDPALEAAGLKLLDELDWHGLAMVEFLYDSDREEYVLMEVNPRFWSSLPFSVQAGADFPAYYWWFASNQPDRISGTYQPGIGGHLIRGELLHLYSILTEENAVVDPPSLARTITNMIRTGITNPRFDYLIRDDPQPFVTDMRRAIEHFRSHRSTATQIRVSDLPRSPPIQRSEEPVVLSRDARGNGSPENADIVIEP